MDSHVIQSPILETSYTRVMGHMDVISIVSDYFNIYFPIILLALTSATYFSLGARCLSGKRKSMRDVNNVRTCMYVTS